MVGMKGPKPELREIEGGLLKAPPPPEGLPDTMLGDWVTVAADLQGRGLLTTSMLGVVETYIVALWTMRECRRTLLADGPVVRGEKGQPKPHPAGAMLKSANETIARLGAELGLTPSSRSRKPFLSDDKPDDDDASALGI
jgi:P27 family predicted phage terminase small subunit